MYGEKLKFRKKNLI